MHELDLNELYLDEISDIMKLMYQRRLIQIRGGNASIIDRENNLVYISPTGIPRHKISKDDIAVIDINGKAIIGLPSSEWRMHLAIYKEIQDAKAIVHAHTPYLLALDKANIKLDLSILTETSLRVKCINEVPLLQPGTQELADSVSKALKEGCNAALLRGHGIVSFSKETIYHALEMVEAIEDLAMIEIINSLTTRSSMV